MFLKDDVEPITILSNETGCTSGYIRNVMQKTRKNLNERKNLGKVKQLNKHNNQLKFIGSLNYMSKYSEKI